MASVVNAPSPLPEGRQSVGGSKTPKIGHFGVVLGPRRPLLPRNGHFGCVFGHPPMADPEAPSPVQG
jgi:hypothetical protein